MSKPQQAHGAHELGKVRVVVEGAQPEAWDAALPLYGLLA